MVKKDVEFLNNIVSFYMKQNKLNEEQFNSLKRLEKTLNKALISGVLK